MMFKQKGVTLIEMMVIFVIITVIGLIAAPVIFGTRNNSNVSWGINGMTESRCIEGYKFIVDQNGGARQILDEFGKGAKCNQGGL